jgi:hypothetical protein
MERIVTLIRTRVHAWELRCGVRSFDAGGERIGAIAPYSADFLELIRAVPSSGVFS